MENAVKTQMKDFIVTNKHTGRLMGAVRAASVEVAKNLAKVLFGSYATAEVVK